jgi:uncharacterized protein YebE (UPF0316 family)
MCIERWIAMGFAVVRMIPNGRSFDLAQVLRDHGFGVTQVNGEGAKGPVVILFTEVQRKKLAKGLRTVREYHHKVFYTIEDVRLTQDGIHPVLPVRGLSALRTNNGH